jgi:hypothetical protein
LRPFLVRFPVAVTTPGMQTGVMEPQLVRSDLAKMQKDSRMVARMVEIFCRGRHADRGRVPYVPSGKIAPLVEGVDVALCEECGKLLSYSLSMRTICPYDPKPTCRKCPTHCYRAGHRERIREVMRYSGWWLVRHGRIDLLRKMI